MIEKANKIIWIGFFFPFQPPYSLSSWCFPWVYEKTWTAENKNSCRQQCFRLKRWAHLQPTAFENKRSKLNIYCQHLLLHFGRALLHCPLAWQMDFTAPCRTYPVLQTKRTLSFKLNWFPCVVPKMGFPGWPQVIAGKAKKKNKIKNNVTIDI